MKFIVKPLTFLLLAAAVLNVAASAFAEVFYVNNRTGHDRNDGIVERPLTVVSGPVRSVSRALELADFGDTIIMANTGKPYYDNLTFQGEKHSGAPQRPFRLIGNGATLTGAMVVPMNAWKEAARDVWQLVPFRKGHFQLIRDGKALPELRPAVGETWSEIPELQVDQWCAWRGSIYYRCERLVEPSSLNMAIARRSCGITVFSAHDLVISDLTIQHFRLDGVNLHDLAGNVQLENLTLRENGRAGLAIGGSSTARVSAAFVERNRDHSVLIQEAAAIELDECRVDVEPTVRLRSTSAVE